MGIRINVPLTQQELTALVKMSSVACRHPRDHARYLIRAEAVRRGLLDEVDEAAQQATGQMEDHDEEHRR